MEGGTGAVVTDRRCKDCIAEGITSKRKAPHPGPRCSTHHRLRRKQLRDTSHGNRIQAVYNLSVDDYQRILEFQGGVCAICGRANGATKRLSVDHCHSDMFVRGLLCGPCNRGVLGHLRDSVEALQRAIDYLLFPPAVTAVGLRKVPED